jgi:hypothetical protein
LRIEFAVPLREIMSVGPSKNTMKVMETNETLNESLDQIKIPNGTLKNAPNEGSPSRV